jgi:23S rRNA (cytidine1920-2'-O)/16S rRNA (cytidine1409-2'-O)-methyltransferase
MVSTMAKTNRLDTLLVERGLLPSRQAAQAAIIDGGVIVDGRKITKPGTATKLDAVIEITSQWQTSPYVSRGGLKLERALNVFTIDVKDRVCLDLGASTGGFTDCLLQRGAAQVYAIDVGFGQLVGSLRQNPRVIVKERVNARFLKREDLYEAGSEPASLAVADLSFISILKVLPACITLLSDNFDVVALIKPQFEAGRVAVGKGGVIRSKEIHLRVLRDTAEAATKLGLSLINATYSPLKGPAGNIEFLAHWRPAGPSTFDLDLAGLVDQAHDALSHSQG